MNKRSWTILLVCLLLVQLLPIVAGADIQQGCTIDVQYRYKNTPLVGAEFDIYQIGTVGVDGSLILAEPYASYPVDTEWLFMGASDIANLIYSYLLMDGVSPMDTITIGADGMGSKGVPEGLYLVAGRKYEDAHGYYTVEPVIVPLPMKYSAEEDGERNVLISPKTRFTPKHSVQTITRSVMKVWDDGEDKNRPEEITVCLLRDREVVDRVTLSPENRWTHRWENLSTAYEWRVAEVSVPGYKVKVDLVLGIFLMTNTKEEPPTEPTEPSEPTVPTEPSSPTEPTDPSAPTEPTVPTDPSSPTEPTVPSGPTEPTVPTDPSSPTEPTSPSAPTVPTVPTEPSNPTVPTVPTAPTTPTSPTPSGPKLPQTGQLWESVVVMLILGVILLALGILTILFDGKIKGIVMILAACCLIGYGFFRFGYNIQDAKHAAVAAEDTLQTIGATMPREIVPAKQFTAELLTLEEVPEEIEDVPYYVVNPQIEMPEQEINGIGYIAALEIPNLQVELPVASQWRESTARVAPCRYMGSAYTKDLIICAHNYKSHFGNLSQLAVGDMIILTDMEGNRFEYLVEDFEVMPGTAIEQMEQGDWDLTLFTCTLGGRSRFAVRCCQQIQE